VQTSRSASLCRLVTDFIEVPVTIEHVDTLL
jgi:hypothetical protein